MSRQPSKSTYVFVGIGGVCFVVGGYFAYVFYSRRQKRLAEEERVKQAEKIFEQEQIKKAKQIKETKENLPTLINKLVEKNEDEQFEILTQLCKLAGEKKSRKELKELNIVPGLMALLRQKPSNTKVLSTLLRGLRDLCAETEIRKVVSKDMKIFIEYMSSSNFSVKEFALRALVNLTLDDTSEDKFRDEGGIIVALQLLEDKNIAPALLLQNLRLLVNLAFNIANKKVIVEHDGLSTVIDLLKEYHETDDDDEDDDDDYYDEQELRLQITIRLVRILGSLANSDDIEIYKKIVTDEIADIFLGLLNIEDDNAITYVLATIATIVRSAKDEEFEKVREGFIKKLMDDSVIEIMVDELESTNKRNKKVATFLLNFLHKQDNKLLDEWVSAIKESGLDAQVFGEK